jgi:hypothetical protein
MAGYNDLIALAEWASYDKKLTKDPADNMIRIGRRFGKLRFIVSIFYEVLLVLEEFEKEPEFKNKLKSRFDPEGNAALKRLRKLRTSPDPTIRELLHRTRNLVTFHYLRPQFTKALEELKSLRGPNWARPAMILYSRKDQRRWYPLAEELKIENAFRIRNGVAQLVEQQDIITGLLDDLAEVLRQSFEAYIKVRAFDDVFPVLKRKTQQHVH